MNTVVHSDEQMLEAITELEARRRWRSLTLTALPLIAAIILIGTASYQIKELQKAHNRLEEETKRLEEKTKTLEKNMVEVGRQLTSAVEAVSAIESLIESKQSYLRTIDEARFLIDARMKFDTVHTALDKVLVAAPELGKVRPWRRWVTVLKSARQPSELGVPSDLLECLGSHKKLAAFRTPNGMLALALLGDGSFTTAYRETVRLRDTKCVPGAYFADIEKWEPVSASGL